MVSWFYFSRSCVVLLGNKTHDLDSGRVTETVQELKKLFRPPSAQILVNVEKKSKYPFIIFGPLSPDFDTRRFVPTSSCKVLSPELRINDGIYDVCGSIFRPGSGFSEQDASVQAVGFVISAFQTFPGEDSQRLEENWITWTGQYVLVYSRTSVSCDLLPNLESRLDPDFLRNEITAEQVFRNDSLLAASPALPSAQVGLHNKCRGLWD